MYLKLSDLVKCFSPDYSPLAANARGSINSLCRQFEIICDVLNGVKRKDISLPYKTNVKQTVEKVNADDLKQITELIARVATHNRVRDYLYNATRNGKKGDRKAPRNKTIAMLDTFAKDENSNVSHDYIAVADKESIEKTQETIINNKLYDTYLPLASDCFGNAVVLAGKDYFQKLYNFYNNKNIYNGDYNYFIMKQSQNKSQPTKIYKINNIDFSMYFKNRIGSCISFRFL